MTVYMGQIMAECDCKCPACEPRGYCMAARIEELEAERDDYAFKLAKANNTYSDMHVAMSEANDKLAKAVEALKHAEKYGDVEASLWASDTLAALKGDT